MPDKMTPFRRRKLLEARERGLTNTDLKNQFGMQDDRTLKRNLQLAEEEEDARSAKREVLREALADHLAELRALIENWEHDIRIQPVTANSPSLAQIRDLESNRLFDSLRNHLPFRTLWQTYTNWRTKYDKYVAECEKLREEIKKETKKKLSMDFGTRDTHVSHVSPVFVDWVLRHVQFGLERTTIAANLELQFRWTSYQLAVPGHSLAVDSLSVQSYTADQLKLYNADAILELVNQRKIDRKNYEQRSGDLLNWFLGRDIVANISALVNDIRDLESRLHNTLEEIRLRRDYIVHTCHLCPGQPRLSR